METAQFLTIILALATVLSAIATAATAYSLYRIFSQGARSQEAQFFFEIVNRYNAIYGTRNRLLAMDLTWSTFNSKYPSIEEKLISDEWRALREVAACYEVIGILLKHKYIDAEIVFDMVVVNPLLWEHASDIIFDMRQRYNPNLWVNWEYLVTEEKKYYERKTK